MQSPQELTSIWPLIRGLSLPQHTHTFEVVPCNSVAACLFRGGTSLTFVFKVLLQTKLMDKEEKLVYVGVIHH